MKREAEKKRPEKFWIFAESTAGDGLTQIGIDILVAQECLNQVGLELLKTVLIRSPLSWKRPDKEKKGYWESRRKLKTD